MHVGNLLTCRQISPPSVLRWIPFVIVPFSPRSLPSSPHHVAVLFLRQRQRWPIVLCLATWFHGVDLSHSRKRHRLLLLRVGAV